VRVLPDTPIWSAAFRRGGEAANAYRVELAKLVNQGIVELAGPIRQEILSGIRDSAQFTAVRDRLRAFSDLPIQTGDYEEAAVCYNRCRSAGIQGSFTDFVICAVSLRHELEIFTDDRDFQNYQRILPIRLYRLGGA
jgi:predicted nucleic acid-binding protein